MMTNYCSHCGKGPFPMLNRHIACSKACREKDQLAFISLTATLWKYRLDATINRPSSPSPPLEKTPSDLEHDLLAVEQNVSVMYHILLRPCSDPALTFLVTVTLLRLFSDPAPTSPMFLVTVTMFQPCSDLAPMPPTFLVTLSQPSRCSDLTPTFLVTPSQYYNSGHSLL